MLKKLSIIILILSLLLPSVALAKHQQMFNPLKAEIRKPLINNLLDAVIRMCIDTHKDPDGYVDLGEIEMCIEQTLRDMSLLSN